MAGVFFSEICMMSRPGTVFLGKRNFRKTPSFLLPRAREGAVWCTGRHRGKLDRKRSKTLRIGGYIDH